MVLGALLSMLVALGLVVYSVAGTWAPTWWTVVFAGWCAAKWTDVLWMVWLRARLEEHA